jgi:hypothetical protein
LQRLSHVVLLLPLLLSFLIASQASYGSTNRAGDTVRNTLTQITQLTAGLLFFAFLVLLDARLS